MNINMFSVKSVVVFILIFCRKVYAEYCEICRNHTMCKYPVSGPGPQCLGYDWSGLLSRDDVIELVSRINERRNLVASGRSRRLPPAANMRKLVWSEELARFAQRWADQCDPSTRPDLEDACRDLPRTPVGQSITTISGPAPGLNVRSFIDVWFMETMDYDGSVSYYNRSRDSKTNHLTQMIWAETDAVGCGRARFLTEYNRLLERLVCNFAKRGNNHGRPVYATGFAATQCPDRMTPDPVYPALCSMSSVRTTEKNSYNSPPVSSLLRILNLANDSIKQEIDPINNSMKQNKITKNGTSEQRIHKIRHVYATHTNNNTYDFPLHWGLLNNSLNNRFQHHQFHQQERGHSRVYHGHHINNDYVLSSRSDVKHETATHPYLYVAATHQVTANNGRRFNQYGIGNMQRQQCTRRQTPCHPSCATTPTPPGCDNKCTRKQMCNPCIGCGGCEHPSPSPPPPTQPPPLQGCGCPAHRTDCPPPAPTRCQCNLNCQCLNHPYQGSQTLDAVEEVPDETRRSDQNYYDLLPNVPKIRSGDSITAVVPQSLPKNKNLWRSRSNKMIKDEEILEKRREVQLKNEYQKNGFRHTKNLDYLEGPTEFSDRQKRESDSQVTFKPFWQIEGYSIKPTDMRALRYTTLPQNRRRFNKKTSRRATTSLVTEPITIEIQKGHRKLGKIRPTEKFLSFEELMHLRKINSGNDNHNGRRNEEQAEPVTEAPKTQREMTLPPHPTPQKHCTRRLTCTWQIEFIDINGSTVAKFDVGAIGPNSGSRTPYGYVEGCSRTSTCTRDHMDRNKMYTATTASENLEGSDGDNDDEEYCERRDLKRRNLGDDSERSDNKRRSLGDHVQRRDHKSPNLGDYVERRDLKRQNLGDNVEEDKIIGYEDFSESTSLEDTKESTKRHCVCNRNFRNKRDTKQSMNANCCKSERNQIMSYGDLHYLVLSKVLKMWRNVNGSFEREHTCMCNTVCRTTKLNILTCITFIVIFLQN